MNELTDANESTEKAKTVRRVDRLLRAERSRRIGCLVLVALALVFAREGRAASAAPTKVACIGEHTTHSHAFPAMNRETQLPGMQEYPAMLQTRLGTSYQVRNFGDCCGTVTQGYDTTNQETHPYVQGSNPGDGPGYTESIAFLPDIVVVGSWGRHDWGKAKASTETWNLAKFQQDYDDLVKRYMNLSSHPKIFVSLPVPILFGQDGPDNGVMTSSVSAAIKAVAAKYNLPTVDLYSPFFNHMELFKQPPDPEGEGEHVTDAGLRIIADKVYAAIVADTSDAGVEGGTGPADASADGRGGTAGGDAGRNADAGATGGAGGAMGTGGATGAGGATGSGGAAGGAGTVGSGGTSVSTGAGGNGPNGSGGLAGSVGAGGTTGATGVGGVAGAPATGGQGGATTEPTAPASSSNGCSCRSAAPSNARWPDIAVLGCLTALWGRSRRRRTRSAA